MTTNEVKFKQLLQDSYFALLAIKKPSAYQKHALRQLRSFLERVYPNLLG